MDDNVVNQKIQSIWPEYSIEKLLGKGAYGTVYQAAHKQSGMAGRVAIKVISLSQLPDGLMDDIQRMESLRGLANIVGIEDHRLLEKEDGSGWEIYIRMELLTPLTQRISESPMSEEEVVRLGYDICSALEICSQRNIIHRDIRPENIYVDRSGNFKLGNFGMGRVEDLSGSSGNYMAPEVHHRKEYSTQADLYSLGILLYRLTNNNLLPLLTEEQKEDPALRKLAKERRFDGENLPPPCQASQPMAALILRACMFYPAQRFATATEMKQQLQRLNGELIVPPSLGNVVYSSSRKGKSAVLPIILVVVAAALLIGGGIALYPVLRSSFDREEKQTEADTTAAETEAVEKNIFGGTIV